MNQSGLFITATGTGVGKTLVMEGLCQCLRDDTKTFSALKPVISGYEPGDAHDLARILEASGQPVAEDSINCYRFADPLSPDMAARREGQCIEPTRLLRFCQEHQQSFTLIEGVGGVMVPLTEHYTVLDWMEELALPVVLVAGTYLGTLSHTLTALEVLHSRKLRVASLVISSSEGEGHPSLEETLITLKNFTDLPMITLPRLDTTQPGWYNALRGIIAN